MQARTVMLSGLFALGLVAACGGRSTIDFDVPGAVSSGGTGNVVILGGGTGGGSGGTGNVSGDGGVGGNSVCDGQSSDCAACTCYLCPSEWDVCQKDGGCADIVDCANKAGCSGIDCYLGPCQSVIDQNGGPFGDSVSLAQDLAACSNNNGCGCGNGSGGSGGGPPGGGGSGGVVSGGGGGTGGTGPIACITCVTQECPAVQECLFDQACRDGAICAVQTCLAGGGQPSISCMLGCFNGDFQAAFSAFQAFQCFFTNCGQKCGGLIPGLPGGGGGGLPPPGG